MRQEDLHKACAITIDVDAYDWDGGADRWGADRKTRKAAMRAASAEEVIAWMKDSHFRDVVMEECDAVGLPPVPNATIYTGHGLCLIYWLGDDLGWTDKEGCDWTPARIKQVIKRFHAHNEDMWWWDSSAKDIGTRLFPIPQGEHRDTGKKVRLIDHCEEDYDLHTWLVDLEQKYPGIPKKQKAKKTKATLGKKKGPVNQNVWTSCIHNPEAHPVLEIGEKAEACPLCDGTGYKRLSEKHYSCFSCSTQFKVIPTFDVPAAFVNPAPDDATDCADEEEEVHPEGYVPLNDLGHALWPAVVPARLVNTARTATGKTFLMEREKKAWCRPGLFHKRVIAIAPTIALAGNLSDRLGIAHGEATSNVDWRTGSFAMCFASLVSKTYGLSGPNLTATYIMMDECETTLSQLVGLLSDGDKARETYNMLVNLCARAGKVMLADANAGKVTLRFIEDVKAAQEQHERLEVIEWTGWYTDRHKHEFEYVSGTFRTNKKGEEVPVRSSEFMHKGRILKAIEDGKKLAIYVPGHYAAKGLARTIKDRFSHLNVQVRVRNVSNDQKNDLSQSGLTADVLVYNNAMNTGVSYDVKDHYDEVHLLIGRGNVTDAIHIEQAVHRVRHPKSKRFIISGTVAAPINDWRCDPAEQVKAAQKRLQAGQVGVNSMKTGLVLAGDWMWEDNSKRLAALQATIIAARYEKGFRWALTCLSASHTFVAGSGEDDADFVRATKDERDRLERELARNVAQAPMLDDVTMAKVEKMGADDEDEYHAFRATKMEQVYGVTGYSIQNEDEKARIVYETSRKRLAQKARVFAICRMMATPEDREAAAEAEIRYNARKTVITAKTTIPSGRVLDSVIGSIGKLCPFIDGRWTITRDDAEKIVTAAVPLMQAAGMKPREDRLTAPHRQLQTLLGMGGLKMRSRREGPRGARVRVYWLAEPDVQGMIRITEAFCQRWRDHGKVLDDEAMLSA